MKVQSALKIALTQYIPKKKHHRQGIKLWVLCDAVTNCYRGATYEDNREEVSQLGQGFTVVKKLMQMGYYLNKGFHLHLDNFFKTKKLARFLQKNSTHVTGTVRLNRKHMLRQLFGKFPVGKKVYIRKGPILQMDFREKTTNKSQFILLSTNAIAKNIQYTIKRGGRNLTRSKPQIVYEYHGMESWNGWD